jgi:uncharacterized protein YggU (UPF0235/DUF167 family)
MFIKVKVFPCSSQEEIKQTAPDSFEIKVKEKPIQGLANKRVVALLAEHFAIMGNSVRLVKGFSQRNKIFEIRKW